MAPIHLSSRSQDDLTPPVPPPSPCHESFRRQPWIDYFAGIAIQPISNWKRGKECTVDPLGQEVEEMSDSDGSSVGASSIFSDLSSNDDNCSIGTVVSEDEDSAEIERITFHVKVETQVFEWSGVIPGGEVPFPDEHSWPPPPIFQYAHSSTLGYRLTDAGERLGRLLTLHTPLYDSQLRIMIW